MKSKILAGLIWKMLERVGTQGVQFIVQIVLARFLLPEDYGVIALIIVFISIASVLVQRGFNTALIQKKNADELDFSSVFYLSLLIAGILYFILFLLAPLVANFYNEPQLIPVLRVLSLTLFSGAVNSIQIAVASRTMQFKRIFVSSLCAILASGTVGVIMAYTGYGAWALVGQELINQAMLTVTLWFTMKWRPKSMISLERIKGLFSYGWKLLCASLIDTIYDNAYSLVIGKVYNPETLGYFNRGNQFPKVIVANFNGSIQSVMLPALSANQDDIARVRSMVRRSVVTSSFIIFPMMTGLAAVAEPLVTLLLTDKWLPCVPFIRISCISYMFWPLHTANLQAINALGRSDIFLKLEIVKKCIGVAVLCISIPFGIYLMVASMPIISIIATVINSFPNKKLMDYSFKEQWLDIIPALLLSVIMGAIVYAIQVIGWNAWVTLFVQVIVGVVVYIGIAYLLKFECFNYLIITMQQLLDKKV